MRILQRNWSEVSRQGLLPRLQGNIPPCTSWTHISSSFHPSIQLSQEYKGSTRCQGTRCLDTKLVFFRVKNCLDVFDLTFIVLQGWHRFARWYFWPYLDGNPKAEGGRGKKFRSLIHPFISSVTFQPWKKGERFAGRDFLQIFMPQGENWNPQASSVRTPF